MLLNTSVQGKEGDNKKKESRDTKKEGQQKKFCSNNLNLMMMSHNKQEYDKVLEYSVLGKAKGSKEADI